MPGERIPSAGGKGVPSPVAYTVKQVTTAEEFSGMERVWNALLSLSPADTYFLRWEWLWGWWETYAEEGDRLAILVVEEGAEIVAIAPFYTRTRLLGGVYPVRRLMFLGTQPESDGDVCSDYMDIICVQGKNREALRSIFEAVAADDLCDEMHLARIGTASETFALLPKMAAIHGLPWVRLNEAESPHIRLPAEWEEYLEGLSSSMRYKVRNERRKIGKLPQVKIARAESHGELQGAFGELVRLHRKRWESKDLSGAFSNGKFASFHRKMMETMMAKGHLDLFSLYAEGSIRAVLYNIAYKGKIYFYQSGIDTGSTRVAFGYVLHSHCIEDAIGRGIGEYDFLPKGKTDTYKERFANGHRTVADVYMARHWAARYFLRAQEMARTVYSRVRPES
ncbi:MAG: GNAT family N-acetyltransferase [Alphaproteobacteria bacterium]|uniref:GNAT family N-acetyltransferase n=1 Tax=Candidatus Nitrobium versatile TaxID=2884831 RepID=A0A953J2M3_9BACT|nr:GNAT family N-acetyltransferase [Candidatus Nitrobium versatile]